MCVMNEIWQHVPYPALAICRKPVGWKRYTSTKCAWSPFLEITLSGHFRGRQSESNMYVCLSFRVSTPLRIFTGASVMLVIISQISKYTHRTGKQNPEKYKLFILMDSNNVSFLLVSWKDLVDSRIKKTLLCQEVMLDVVSDCFWSFSGCSQIRKTDFHLRLYHPLSISMFRNCHSFLVCLLS